ncbi:hypothetical protein MRX96_006269 [Rhipicephalus microplus]
MFSPGFFLDHDCTGRGQHNVAELSGRHEVAHPRLGVLQLDVEAGADDIALIEPANEEDHDLKLLDVAVLHQDCEEYDNDFRARPDDHMALARFSGMLIDLGVSAKTFMRTI